MPRTSLQSLADLGSFPIYIEGEAQIAIFSGKHCVYYEWAFGFRGPDGWLTYWNGDRTLAPLTIKTPLGDLELRLYQARLYLAPSYDHMFSPRDAFHAPGLVREKIRQERKPVCVEEFRLDFQRKYFGFIEVDLYTLPPQPGEKEPSEARNLILAISDKPYKKGRPQSRLTPACLGFSY